MIGKNFAMIAKISLYSEFLAIAKLFCFMFLGSNDPRFCFFHFYPHCNDTIWDRYGFFHLFVRLYKPSYKHFVT